MKPWKMAGAPIEICIVFLGYPLYAVAGFIPLLSIPTSPTILFATFGAWMVMITRDRKWYWFSQGTGLLEMLWPVWDRTWITVVDDPSVIEIYCVFFAPALLLLLLASPRVRRYIRQPA